MRGSGNAQITVRQALRREQHRHRFGGVIGIHICRCVIEYRQYPLIEIKRVDRVVWIDRAAETIALEQPVERVARIRDGMEQQRKALRPDEAEH